MLGKKTWPEMRVELEPEDIEYLDARILERRAAELEYQRPLTRRGRQKPPPPARRSYLFCRLLIKSSTTAGSASVEVSPSAP